MQWRWRQPTALPLIVTRVRGDWCPRCNTSSMVLVDLQVGNDVGQLVDVVAVCQGCDLHDQGMEIDVVQ